MESTLDNVVVSNVFVRTKDQKNEEMKNLYKVIPCRTDCFCSCDGDDGNMSKVAEQVSFSLLNQVTKHFCAVARERWWPYQTKPVGT